MDASFQIKSIKENNDFFIIEGYASNFNTKDFDNEVVCQGAFKRSLHTLELLENKGERPLLWHHNVEDVPIGRSILKEDSNGLFNQAFLPKDDDFVKGRIIPQCKIGSIKNMSFGYKIKDFYRKDGKKYLTDIEIYEVSLVNIPSNTNSKILSIKTAVSFQDLPLADEDREWDKNAAIQRVRAFTGSEENPTTNYKKAFLWYDKEEADLFGSYKLPIADVIDNTLKAVPRAIFAAAAAISGARNGVDIPEKDKKKIKNNINKYYKKMDRESPFEDKKNYDFKNLKDICKFLKNKGLTNSETDNIIYNIKQIVITPCNEGYETYLCNKDIIDTICLNRSCKEICDSIKEITKILTN
jgi:HK97 family phage prohead protease